MDERVFKVLRQIGRNIQTVRESLRLSQDEFAKRSGLSRFQVLRGEAGRGEMRLSTLIKIADTFATPFATLFHVPPTNLEVTEIENESLKISPPSQDAAPNIEDKAENSENLRTKYLKTLLLEQNILVEFNLDGGEECFLFPLSGTFYLRTPSESRAVQTRQGYSIRGTGIFRLINLEEQVSEVLIWVR